MDQPPLEPDRFWQPEPNRTQKSAPVTHSVGPQTARPAADFTIARPIQNPRALFKVLGSSVIAALLLVFGLVQFYGRNERSASVERMLVAPTTLEQLYFADKDPQTGKKVSFSLDKICFQVAGSSDPKPVEVSTQDYSEIYGLVKKDEAIRIVTQDLERRFNDPMQVSSIMIFVKTQDRASSATPGIVLQQIEFIDSSPYYRVSLRQSGDKDWKYYKHTMPLGSIVKKILQA